VFYSGACFTAGSRLSIYITDHAIETHVLRSLIGAKGA
jgi:hypothetical protein